EHARTFVDQRVDRALDDFFGGDWPAAYTRRIGGALDQRKHFGVRHRLPVVAVDVPPLAGLLPEAAHLTQRVRDERLAVARFAELIQFLTYAPRDVDPGHVVHREHAHRHAEVSQRAIHLLGRRPVLDEELALIHVGE